MNQEKKVSNECGGK
jgi:hypothetical protein